ncbi:MAG: DUF4340 domain-containing protein [Treponemataceae bacterium]
MKTRKILLLAAVAILGCAYALELVFTNANPVKTFTLTEKPDSLLIEKGDGTKLLISKDGDRWLVGDKKYSGDTQAIETLVKSISAVKILDSVSSGADVERFGLGDGEKLAVSAKSGNKELRRLAIGKASPTSQQSYIHVDGGKEVLLVSGNLKRDFGKAPDEFRDKAIFSFKNDEIAAISVSGKENYTLSKGGKPEAWSVSSLEKGLKADKERLDAWLSSIATLRAESYAPDDALPTEKPLGVAVFKLASREATVRIYRKEGESKYLCSSTESPYPFYLSVYTAERYLKPLSELTTK